MVVESIFDPLLQTTALKMSGKEKKATRGQKQIHEENRQTVLHYALASLISTVLALVVVTMFSSSGRWVIIGPSRTIN